MARSGKVRRSLVRSFASAFLGSALAIVVNLATEWKYDVVAWVVVVLLTVLIAVASLLTGERQESTPDNDISFGRHLRAGRISVLGKANRVDVGDDSWIKNFEASAGGD
jgi:hypothetical protein